MVSRTHNLFEGEIGSVPPAPKKGDVILSSPKAILFYKSMTSGAKHATIISWSLTVEGMAVSKICIYITVRISYEGSEIMHTMPFHGKMEEPIIVWSIPVITDFVNELVSNDMHGIIAWQSKMSLIDQVVEKIKPSFDEANSRLRDDIEKYKSQDSVQLEVENLRNDRIRSIFHHALKKFKKIDPELLHKYLDEFFVSEIHNS